MNDFLSGFETLLWAIPVLFSLGLLFAILLWCRSWRTEEQLKTDRRLEIFTSHLTNLSDALEKLEKILSAARDEDRQLAEQVKTLSADVHQVLTPAPSRPTRSPSAKSEDPDRRPDSGERYRQARALLAKGEQPLEVARRLDIGLGDVQVILRTMELEKVRDSAKT